MQSSDDHEEQVICLRCGLVINFPEQWTQNDWEDNDASEDCNEQMVRQVMES